MGYRNTAAFLAIAISSTAIAANHTGTLTDIEGRVLVFKNPGSEIQGPPPHAKYEGEYYSVQTAEPGMTVENGNILRTTPDAKARIIFENGDQFHVGPGTAFRVKWQDGKGKAQVSPIEAGKFEMSLTHGTLRGVIQKGGPRSRLIIKTKAATMGVRGTDFLISDAGIGNQAVVSVLRGSVEVKPTVPNAKPVEVKPGFTARIQTPVSPPPSLPSGGQGQGQGQGKNVRKPAAPTPVIKIQKATVEELTQIRKVTQVASVTAPPAGPVSQKIQLLREQAIQTTLKDIEAVDPQAAKQLRETGKKSLDELNTETVKKLEVHAPRASELSKEEEEILRRADEKGFNGAQ